MQWRTTWCAVLHCNSVQQGQEIQGHGGCRADSRTKQPAEWGWGMNELGRPVAMTTVVNSEIEQTYSGENTVTVVDRLWPEL